LIIDELTVHDFGVYAGRQPIALTPVSRDRPIILFGGLNGAGKTTLLDALQLGTYGPAAAVSNRSGGAYEDYLRGCLHRGAAAPEAAIEIAFRHVSEGRERAIRLHRSWAVRGNRLREYFEVIRDGEPDALAAEHWTELVEEIMPARIAELFLFDGEKIESYADLEGASRLIRTAIQNLLGLDVIEQLSADLVLLERRKRSESRPAGEADVTSGLKVRREALEAERRTHVQRRAAAVNELERLEAALIQREEAYRREGGILAEQRFTLEGSQRDALVRLDELRRGLREIASGPLPLAMVTPLLERLQSRWREQSARLLRSSSREAVRAERDAIRALIAAASIDAVARQGLLAAIDQRDEASDEECLPARIPPNAAELLEQLQPRQLDDERARARHTEENIGGTRRKVADIRDAIASIPPEERLAPFARDLETARRTLADARVEQEARADTIGRLDREIEDLRAQEMSAHEAMMRERFASEDLQRVLTQSSRVRDTLATFRTVVVRKHASRIEAAILRSFHELARKRSLISAVRIDPETFSLDLVGNRGERVTPERLSAGERQILAVAVLWGLARASGRPLPTVIDTPLGRLDSAHRRSLVERYFPNVSHQTILLSTDEEIAGPTLRLLRPSIGRSYRLVHDEAIDATRVEHGELETSLGH
jgi:DNA sulfur modification protein DndD